MRGGLEQNGTRNDTIDTKLGTNCRHFGGGKNLSEKARRGGDADDMG